MEKLGKKAGFCLALALCVVLAFFIVPLRSQAEDVSRFPTKPITMIVEWPAGGTSDLSTRKISELAGKVLGQPIIIENKAGGGGVIGTNAIAKADPDGYTIGHISHSPLVMVPHLRPVPYNPGKIFRLLCNTPNSYTFLRSKRIRALNLSRTMWRKRVRNRAR